MPPRIAPSRSEAVFAQEGWSIEVLADGDEALRYTPRPETDCILLGARLSGDGIEICRALRARTVGAPILMLTAQDAPIDRAAARDPGADDYLAKPFGLDELLSRVACSSGTAGPVSDGPVGRAI